MSSVLSEYPETLPAPMVGVVTPTERRKVGSIGGVQSFRTVQRDRHGTRTYAFTFTKEQAAIFRDWWVEWEQRGGGWFAANWPLPWSRGPNVFRFKNPPEWALIGGGIDGQGYWRVSGAVEIRGRGMLPTVEVLYLTSKPYPIVHSDSIYSHSGSYLSARKIIIEVDTGVDNVSLLTIADLSSRDTVKTVSYDDRMSLVTGAVLYAKTPQQTLSVEDAVNFTTSAFLDARAPLITINYNQDRLNLTTSAELYVN